MIEEYELLAEVRGRGLMIGLEFGKPRSLKLRPGWSMLQTARVGLFAQMVVVALFQRHRILTQVSGDHTEVIKLLPPLMIGDDGGRAVPRGVRRRDEGRAQGQRPDVGLRAHAGQAGGEPLTPARR